MTVGQRFWLPSGRFLGTRISAALLLLPVLAVAQTLRPSNQDPEALFKSGMNALLGTGPSHNELEAANKFRISADLGYVPAQTVLGYLYESGRGVAPNPQEAARWYRKAADQDDPLAEWILGRTYFSGMGDISEAEKWLRRAAAHDDPFGEYLLGLALEDRDYRKAPEWFLRAAQQGLPQAQRKYGLALQEGHSIERNDFEAYVWLLLAFQAGDQSVALNLQTLEGILVDAKIQEAKQRAQDLRRSTSRLTIAHGCTGWPGEFGSLPASPPPDLQAFCR